MLTSLALCAHKGILVKDGRALELMNDIDTVLFDKTGTLTQERPEVGHITAYNGHQKQRLLQLVAAAVPLSALALAAFARGWNEARAQEPAE